MKADIKQRKKEITEGMASGNYINYKIRSNLRLTIILQGNILIVSN